MCLANGVVFLSLHADHLASYQSRFLFVFPRQAPSYQKLQGQKAAQHKTPVVGLLDRMSLDNKPSLSAQAPLSLVSVLS